MTIVIPYDLGQTLYLKTDKEQKGRILTKFEVRRGSVMFCLVHETSETWHFDFEIREEIDELSRLLS